ncbi:hypothetical protein [Fimbriiglobus ruber]|uniref:hypothetical protein n=1 Tax=Fimbriiglobus ruber TaxID=1908690 RepID=UPI00137A06C6|nr:hypothetical protein [Fimbriiglobus ruber]
MIGSFAVSPGPGSNVLTTEGAALNASGVGLSPAGETPELVPGVDAEDGCSGGAGGMAGSRGTGRNEAPVGTSPRVPPGL